MSFVGPTMGDGWTRLVSCPLMPTSPGAAPGQRSTTSGSVADAGTVANRPTISGTASAIRCMEEAPFGSCRWFRDPFEESPEQAVERTIRESAADGCGLPGSPVLQWCGLEAGHRGPQENRSDEAHQPRAVLGARRPPSPA